jgi:hypothetical protein
MKYCINRRCCYKVLSVLTTYFTPKSLVSMKEVNCLLLYFHLQMMTFHPTSTQVIPRVFHMRYLDKIIFGYICISYDFVFALISSLLCRFRHVSEEENNQQSTYHRGLLGVVVQIEDEPDIVGAMYNDTSGFLEKGEDALRWGDVYQMFKKKTSPLMQRTRMNSRFSRTSESPKIHRVASHVLLYSPALMPSPGY